MTTGAKTRHRASPRLVAWSSLVSAALVVYAAIYPTTLTWHQRKEPLTVGLVIAVVGAGWLAAGCYAWHSRPSNSTGRLMLAVGLGWLSYQLSWLPNPAGYLQFFTNGLELPFLAWVALAYPIGRLRSRSEVLVAVLAALTWIWGTVWGFLTSNLLLCDLPCPSSFQLVDLTGVQQTLIFGVSNAGAIVLASVVLAFVVRHWVQATKRARRSVAPLLWMAVPPVAWVVYVSLGQMGLLPSGWSPFPWFNLALLTVPLGYAYSQIRNRLDRGRVGELLLELRDARDEALPEKLARTLQDPSVEIVYWLPEAKRFADLSGQPVELPGPHDPQRAATVLDRDGEPLAAVIHDTAVADDPELMASAAAAVRMALENSRLQALVRTQLDEVRASRARIVAAQDDERRRLERDLHDGAQQRLVTLSLLLGEARRRLADDPDPALAAALESASSQVGEALVEVRELAHGISPAVLVRAGLLPAIRSIAERSTVPVVIEAQDIGRLPAGVETAAYFVVSESVANATKHARARLITVRVAKQDAKLRIEVLDDGIGGADLSAGTGLRGLSDRVRAIDGRLTVTSEAAGGTHVTAEIPCE